MAKTPEEHNRMRGQALAIMAMDHLRERTAVGEQVTLWSLNRDICERYRIKGAAREYQYHAFRRAVIAMEAAGLVTTERVWDKEKEKTYLIIRLCPSSAN